MLVKKKLVFIKRYFYKIHLDYKNRLLFKNKHSMIHCIFTSLTRTLSARSEAEHGHNAQAHISITITPLMHNINYSRVYEGDSA